MLFTRDVRCVNLTPAGRLALQHAEKIVNLTGEFRQIVSNREALRGTVRIGAADTIVYAWLPLLIRRMNEQYPGVSLDLTIDTSLKLSQRIQNGEVDVGFIMGPIMAADIYNSPLCTFESCWVGAVEPAAAGNGRHARRYRAFSAAYLLDRVAAAPGIARASRFPWPVG